MRILILTPLIPYPPYRGDKLKLYNLIKNLARHHEIVLLAFTNTREDRKAIPVLSTLCAEVRTVHLPLWRSVLHCAFNIFSSRPFQVAYFSSGRMRGLLRRTLDNERFDVIYTHYIRMAQYTEGIDGTPGVLDLTDAKSLYLKRFMQKERNALKRVLLRSEYKRMSEYEKILSRYELSLVCSEVDRKVLLEAVPGARISLLENGVDVEYFSPDESVTPEQGNIICTGNMSYFPNADGVEYFVREIFPLVKKRVPGARFLIVGQTPPASIRALAASDIVVTGAVPDIRSWYLRSLVAVSPIRFGSGTLNKVLEPMALGIPVVATPVGTEGLPLRNGEHIMIAESPAHFAECVADLLENAGLRERLSSGAGDIVRARYGWVSIARQLETFFTEVVADARPGT
jgi:sugar transferase (PEP-CTERM/EpsH1 system associated)